MTSAPLYLASPVIRHAGASLQVVRHKLEALRGLWDGSSAVESFDPLSALIGSRPSDHYFRSVCLFVMVALWNRADHCYELYACVQKIGSV